MDLLQTLLTRRSPALGTLREPGPTPEQLTTMLTIAARVPDHGKLAPWRFIVIAGESRRRLGRVIGGVWSEKYAALKQAEPAAFEQGVAKWSAHMMSAPVVVAVVSCPRVHPKIPRWEQELSCGAVCMNLLLAAKGLGFGAVWLTEWCGYDEHVAVELGVTGPDEKLAGFVHIGTQSEAREDRDRPRLSDIVRHY